MGVNWLVTDKRAFDHSSCRKMVWQSQRGAWFALRQAQEAHHEGGRCLSNPLQRPGSRLLSDTTSLMVSLSNHALGQCHGRAYRGIRWICGNLSKQTRPTLEKRSRPDATEAGMQMRCYQGGKPGKPSLFSVPSRPVHTGGSERAHNVSCGRDPAELEAERGHMRAVNLFGRNAPALAIR